MQTTELTQANDSSATGTSPMPKVTITTAGIEAQSQSQAQTAGQQAYANLTKLRTAAEKCLSTVIAQGRKAKLELV